MLALTQRRGVPGGSSWALGSRPGRWTPLSAGSQVSILPLAQARASFEQISANGLLHWPPGPYMALDLGQGSACQAGVRHLENDKNLSKLAAWLQAAGA